ncbi:MAG: tRNA 4-thiouridine(8) synthase ThiI [Treponema sp.]|jgi:thiamine biosynthesis protein ThiI|nr:tRNA 4-thiouridine(8) synthase ThiI [Treponema sp.]
MMTTYLIKLGELTLKGGNRRLFEITLRRNLSQMLKGTNARIIMKNGRFYVECQKETEAETEDALDRLMGISGWAKTKTVEKTLEAVTAACVEEALVLRERGISTFKVEARRTDKRLPFDSYQIRCAAGDAVLAEVPGLTVDVHNPGGLIEVEIRERAYVFANAREGRRGLPVGTAGRGLLLLSGGIDSPVAGYMMASRGLMLEAVYFHAYPYTSAEAQEKVVSLAEIVGRYTQGLRLFSVSFTALQTRIKERTPEAWRTVVLRMAMMDCAQRLAVRRGSKCLISGESLSQVASQTIENISCTQSMVKLPILRPLIGMNKEEIIEKAQRIGTYQTSILPYQDCCSIFTPPHPILHGDPDEALKIYHALEADALIEQALADALEPALTQGGDTRSC